MSLKPCHFRVQLYGRTSWLANQVSLSKIDWRNAQTEAGSAWLLPTNSKEFGALIPLASSTSTDAIFETNSLGVTTNRDSVVYDFQSHDLLKRMQEFAEDYNGEIDRFRRTDQTTNVDDFVTYDRVKWSETLKLHLARGHHATFQPSRLRSALWRPFTRKSIYFDKTFIDRQRSFPRIFPTSAQETENLVICCTNHSSYAVSDRMTSCAKCLFTVLSGHECTTLQRIRLY